MEVYSFKIDPVAAPRMTQADRWNKRPAVTKYFAFRNEFKYLANLQSLYSLPEIIGGITFYLSMPASWSNKKRDQMNGTPHTVRPDLDNLLKSVLDSLCTDDNYIHSIGLIKKVWSETGSIDISVNYTQSNTYKQGEIFVDENLY